MNKWDTYKKNVWTNTGLSEAIWFKVLMPVTEMVLEFLFLSKGKSTFMQSILKVIKCDPDKCFHPVMGVKLRECFWEGVKFGLEVLKYMYVDQLQSGWPMWAFLVLSTSVVWRSGESDHTYPALVGDTQNVMITWDPLKQDPGKINKVWLKNLWFKSCKWCPSAKKSVCE